MRMNTLIPLQAQTPDIAGSFHRGQQMRQQMLENERANALAAFLQESGGDVIRGDENALAAYAGFDPRAALGIQSERQGMDLRQRADSRADTQMRHGMSVDNERLALARAEGQRAMAEHAMRMDAATRQQEAAALAPIVKAAEMAFNQGPEAWTGFMQRHSSQMPEDWRGLTYEDAPYAIQLATGMWEGLSGEGFTLKPGDVRFDAGNNPVAAVPAAPEADPTTVREYLFAQSQGETRPYTEWLQDAKRAGASNVSVNTGGEGQRIGAIPQGYAAVQDPANPSGFRMEMIPGGPASAEADAAAEQAAMRSDQTARYGRVVMEDIGHVRSAVEKSPIFNVGPLGGLLSRLPGTSAFDTSQMLSTIRANIGFDRLQQMREASPTGGALGAVSNFENELLQATLGALGQSQGEEQFLRNLNRLEEIYTEVVHGPPPSGVSMADWVKMPDQDRVRFRAVPGAPNAPSDPSTPQIGGDDDLFRKYGIQP